MKIKEATFQKEFKCGLPNFSNITVTYGFTVELQENEELDTARCWDLVNNELYIQTSGIEPDWITNKEFGKYFKTIIKTSKLQEGGDK